MFGPLQEIEDLEERLAAIEQKLGEQNKKSASC
jgi:hypothetical protein